MTIASNVPNSAGPGSVGKVCLHASHQLRRRALRQQDRSEQQVLLAVGQLLDCIGRDLPAGSEAGPVGRAVVRFVQRLDAIEGQPR
ncbi:hypothetical protein [Pseudonocardia sp. TRM90224]|uniref:hypothetical protein n=1 Tax=Pseudonocardia sp. TRM90224 TaxID=2812678 RepID=UPI001E2FFFA7|nr:hypothetical protein [Pseudonocardia sp. TRM90224]